MSLGTDRKFPQDLLGRYGGMTKEQKAILFTTFQAFRDQVFVSDELSPLITNLAMIDNGGICYGPQTRILGDGSTKVYKYFMCPLQGVSSTASQIARYCCGLYGVQQCCPYDIFESSIETVSPPKIPPVSVIALIVIILCLFIVVAAFLLWRFMHTQVKKEAARSLKSGLNSQTAGVSHIGAESLVSARSTATRGAALSQQSSTDGSNFQSPKNVPPASHSSLSRPVSAASILAGSQTSLGVSQKVQKSKRKDVKPKNAHSLPSHSPATKSAPASIAPKQNSRVNAQKQHAFPSVSVVGSTSSDRLISATRYAPVKRQDADL